MSYSMRWLKQKDITRQRSLDIAIALDDTIVESAIAVDVTQAHMLLTKAHLWLFVLYRS